MSASTLWANDISDKELFAAAENTEKMSTMSEDERMEVVNHPPEAVPVFSENDLDTDDEDLCWHEVFARREKRRENNLADYNPTLVVSVSDLEERVLWRQEYVQNHWQAQPQDEYQMAAHSDDMKYLFEESMYDTILWKRIKKEQLYMNSLFIWHFWGVESEDTDKALDEEY